MALSNGYRIQNMGASNTVNWYQSEIFIKDTSANTTLTFVDTHQTLIRLIINNTSASEIFMTFSTPGKTIRNLSDTMLRVRPLTTLIYEFTADASGNFLYCLSPVRLEAIFAP